MSDKPTRLITNEEKKLADAGLNSPFDRFCDICKDYLRVGYSCGHDEDFIAELNPRQREAAVIDNLTRYG